MIAGPASARRALNRLRPGPVVLMYHRVARPLRDPWALAVAPQRFAEQMAVMKRRRTVLAMDDFVERWTARTLPRDAAAITFDDGYLDNLEVAAPVLAREGLPATIFLAAAWIGSDRPYWWDEVAAMWLGPEPIAAGALELADGPLAWDALPPDPPEQAAWLGWEPPRTARQALHADVWSRLRAMDEPDRVRSLEDLRARLPVRDPELGRAMRADEVRALASAGEGLISIGGHTLTHPPLGRLDGEALRREVEEGRALSEALCGRPTSGFAYPHGDHGGDAREAVRRAGYAWACTTDQARVRPGGDRLTLPRFAAPDLDGDGFKRWLSTC